MATPFGITAATAEVKLDEKRQAETVFNVFNASGRYIRGRAELKTTNPAAREWLTVGGDRDRDFPVGGSVQYPVRISVPPDAPPGRYEFRLDMVGVQNPEEEFTAGPAVSFQVPEPPPPPPPPWWKKWWIWLIAGIVLVVGVLLAVIFWPDDDGDGVELIPVPNVVGMPRQTAQDTLAVLGLHSLVTDSVPSESVAAGNIVRSDPAEETLAEQGDTVRLTISTGPPRDVIFIDFEVPRISGRTVRDPYRDPDSGVTFTTPAANGALGLVWNSQTSACVEPPDRNQMLGTGTDAASIGRAAFPIQADLPDIRPAGTQVSVDFQSLAGATVRLRLLDARGNEAGGSTASITQGGGTCGLPGPTRGRQRITAAATAPFRSVLIEGSPGRVWVIDSFEIH